MSMPGFVFHFRCTCGASSGSYSVYPFPSTFDPGLTLPAWSKRHKFWGSFSAMLTEEERVLFEKDRLQLLDFAESISTENMTVGVPLLVSGGVELDPKPCCPHCGEFCESVFGCPENKGKPEINSEMLEDFDSTPIALAEFSVRARMICADIGIVALGDLIEYKSEIEDHPRMTDTVMREIDNVLALKPCPRG